MAHEIHENDSMLLAGKQAWHGLGIVLPDAFTVEEALTTGGLDWRVEREPMFLNDGSEVESHVANVRGDTGEMLAVVGSDYSILQNRDLGVYVNDVCGDATKLESAGSMKNGREVFMLARMDSFEATEGDVVERYALFSNAHDGSRAFRVLPTSVRVVCNNTLTMALGAKRSGIAVRHTTNLAESIESAKAALQGAIIQGDQFKAQVGQMVAKPLNKQELESFFAAVYMKANKVKLSAQPKTDAEARAFRKATKVVGDWVALMDDEKNLVGGMGGTGWAALNAVTEWSDHERTVRVTSSLGGEDEQAKQTEARTYSNWLGSSADFKAVALRQALETL